MHNLALHSSPCIYHPPQVMGDQEIVARLLSLNADVKLRDNFGKTPLHIAAETGNVPMATLLIEGGAAQVDAADVKGRTPLFVAVENKQVNEN